jgi:hypothetical protein
MLARAECLRQLATASVDGDGHTPVEGAARWSKPDEQSASVARIAASGYQTVSVQDANDASGAGRRHPDVDGYLSTTTLADGNRKENAQLQEC